ncbi:hypothetical protein HYFRA_00008806 [Hymenoscyphus fraxineus]|uniref:Uncharacterized protein n=1 Tax=Hymenoscyphus fraxineus TaxID=746836 RepID=A0A9N9L1P9_9HELO|nr:hypothetical protein HYFRA_00008806 [Hymenoscyphus fraxineus]
MICISAKLEKLLTGSSRPNRPICRLHSRDRDETAEIFFESCSIHSIALCNAMQLVASCQYIVSWTRASYLENQSQDYGAGTRLTKESHAAVAASLCWINVFDVAYVVSCPGVAMSFEVVGCDGGAELPLPAASLSSLMNLLISNPFHLALDALFNTPAPIGAARLTTGPTLLLARGVPTWTLHWHWHWHHTCALETSACSFPAAGLLLSPSKKTHPIASPTYLGPPPPPPSPISPPHQPRPLELGAVFLSLSLPVVFLSWFFSSIQFLVSSSISTCLSSLFRRLIPFASNLPRDRLSQTQTASAELPSLNFKLLRILSAISNILLSACHAATALCTSISQSSDSLLLSRTSVFLLSVHLFAISRKYSTSHFSSLKTRLLSLRVAQRSA